MCKGLHRKQGSTCHHAKAWRAGASYICRAGSIGRGVHVHVWSNYRSGIDDLVWKEITVDDSILGETCRYVAKGDGSAEG